jgi:hypothetical protein
MLSEDDDVGVAEEARASDSDEVVVGDPEESAGAGPGTSRQRGRRWNHPAKGDGLCWFVVDESVSSQARHEQVPPDPRLSGIVPGSVGCIGAVRIRWTLSKRSAAEDRLFEDVMGAPAKTAKTPLGYLDYEVEEVFSLDDVVLMQGSQRARWAEILPAACADLRVGDVGTVKEAVAAGLLNQSLRFRCLRRPRCSMGRCLW